MSEQKRPIVHRVHIATKPQREMFGTDYARCGARPVGDRFMMERDERAARERVEFMTKTKSSSRFGLCERCAAKTTPEVQS